MNFEALEFENGRKNIPGLKPIGYYGFTDDAQSIPEIAASPASMSVAGVISTNVVMKAGKTMYPMYGTLKKLNLKGEAQGERDSMTKVRTVTWKYPDTNAEAIGFDIGTNNQNMFFIFTDHNDRKRMIGNKSIPAQIKAADDSGTGPSDEKGYTFEISDFGIGAAPIYTGDIPVDSSLISGEVGV
jgi:hypothetical protein